MPVSFTLLKIRTFFVPTVEERSFTITLPEGYIGKEIEILAFPTDVQTTRKAKPVPTFTALRLDTQGFTFNRDEANAR